MTKLSDISLERILLDTNVLNNALMVSKSSDYQKQFLELSLHNELNICDTVYYEFLRNCSLQTYRERVCKLDEIKPAIRHIRDAPQYFNTVWLLYLYALRNDPGKFVSIDLQDIHIASCAIHEKIDVILTENARDFPSELFSSTALDIESGKKVFLVEFDRSNAKKLWIELISNDYKFTINGKSFKVS